MNKTKSRESVGDELMRWFAYGVIVSLLPLGAHFIITYLHAPRAPSLRSSLLSTIADGELLLVGSCIGAGAIGERIGRPAVWRRVEPIFVVLCGTAVLLSAGAYGLNAAGVVARKSRIPGVSLGLFWFIVLMSALLTLATFRSREKIDQ
jgi:hypothetical protein